MLYGNFSLIKTGEFGWGGVEEWGENADNYNWTTIKLKKNFSASIWDIP